MRGDVVDALGADIDDAPVAQRFQVLLAERSMVLLALDFRGLRSSAIS